MTKSVIWIILTALSIPTLRASAFDGHRKGFLIGFGLGTGITTRTNSEKYEFPYQQSHTYKYRTTRLAIMNDRKFGYAPSDLWEIYLTNKSAYWGSFDDGDGVIGLGLTKMSAGQIPAKFYTFGIGIPHMRTIAWDFDANNFGLFGGWGYEFRKHLNMEFNLLYGHRVRHLSHETETDNNFAARFLLNILAY
jgi:hypothetical protein